MNGKDFKLFARDRGIGSGQLDKYQKISGGRLGTSIVDHETKGINPLDIFTRLMMERIIFLGTEIDEDVANIINSQMLFLSQDDDEKPIQLYINSPGGSCYAGLAMYDTMQHVDVPVHTLVTGIAASMAFVLTCAGEPGHRYSLPHSRLMQHQPSGSPGWGDTSNLEIFHKEMKEIQSDLYGIIASHTGQTKRRIKQDCDRDHWMRPNAAKEYGVIDHVLESKKPHAVQ